MPAFPSCLVEPIWGEFAAVLPSPEAHHPLGCHRHRIPDRVVFDHVTAALVHGTGYARIASPGCSDRTIRRRLHAWAAAGLMPNLHALVLAQYDRMIGLELADVAGDGCITKAPCGGEVARRSPVNWGTQGLTRSLVVDAAGIPPGAATAPANRPDSLLLEATLDTLHRLGPLPETVTVQLDRGYDSGLTRQRLVTRGAYTGRLPCAAHRPP